MKRRRYAELDTYSNSLKFVDLLGPRACIAKVAPKMASRKLSARLRGGPGEDFGAALAAALGPPGAQEAPGGLRELILDPGEIHFGGSGGRFLSAPDAHLRSAAGKQSSNRAHMQKHAMHLS